MKLTNRSLVILVALEGAFVMAFELLVGNLLRNIYGSSLLVWTPVIGVTMSSLMFGYLLGSHLSSKENLEKWIFRLLISGMTFSVFTVPIHHLLWSLLPAQNLYFESLLNALLLLAPTIIVLGAIPTLVSVLLSRDSRNLGYWTGLAFSNSSIAGVFSILFAGFFLISHFGTETSFYILIFASLLVLTVIFKKYRLIGLVFILTCFSLALNVMYLSKSDLNIMHSEDSLLGRLEVVDIGTKNAEGRKEIHRSFNINNIPQSIIIKGRRPSFSVYKHVHLISSLTTLKENSDILLIGLAGGAMVSELHRHGHQLTVVDIDKRMKRVASDFFYTPSFEFVEDDGRHYVNRTKKKFDIVIIDVSAAETQPFHLYTIEAFNQIESILSDDGMLIINYVGTLNYDQAATSMFKTLKQSNFKNVNICSTDPNISNDNLFVASKSEINWNELSPSKQNACCLAFYDIGQLIEQEIILEHFKESEYYSIFRDDLPILDHYRKFISHENRLFALKEGKKNLK